MSRVNLVGYLFIFFFNLSFFLLICSFHVHQKIISMSGEPKTETKKTISSKYVKLNVGGRLYYTTIETLTKHDTMLRAMFSGRMDVLTDSEGREQARVHF